MFIPVQRFMWIFPVLLGFVLFGLLPEIAHARTCEVALWLDDEVALGALQFNVDYSAVAGSFVPGPDGLACEDDATNALAVFGDHPDERLLTASVLSLAGVFGPTKLVHCQFHDVTDTALASNFVVIVTDASDPAGRRVQAPDLSVSLPDCGDETTTTTSTTTSTTSTTTTSTTSTSLSPCGNGLVDDMEQCDDGNAEPGDGCEDDCSSDVVCGDASGDDSVHTGDALLVLRAAVGQPVTCPHYLCDADGDAKLRTADSLRVLKRAVGQSVVMSCPPLA